MRRGSHTSGSGAPLHRRPRSGGFSMQSLQARDCSERSHGMHTEMLQPFSLQKPANLHGTHGHKHKVSCQKDVRVSVALREAVFLRLPADDDICVSAVSRTVLQRVLHFVPERRAPMPRVNTVAAAPAAAR